MLITIKDETFTGDVLHELALEFQTERVTVKDIITERVMQEVAAYNSKLPEKFFGLVQPTDTEKKLNGFSFTQQKRKKIDAEKQVYVALEAFNQNAYFVLIDDKQCDDLNQEVLLRKDTTISFLKLTPLVGG
ncbi:MAG: hypothetical protein AAGI07_00970 [Bacteroidota bacterium]